MSSEQIAFLYDVAKSNAAVFEVSRFLEMHECFVLATRRVGALRDFVVSKCGNETN